MSLSLDNPKQLTTPVVVTKPTDLLATVDVYKEKARGVVNSIQDKAKALGIDLSAIAQGAEAAKKLMPLIDAVKNKDPSAIMDRMMSAMGKEGSLFKILPEGFRETASATFQDYGSQIIMLNDVATAVRTTDFNNINSITRLVNNMSGNQAMMKFVDTDGVSSALASVVNEAKELGLPSLLSTVTSTITDTEIALRTAWMTVPSAIRHSDIRLLGEINDIFGSGNLYSAQPNIINDFVQKFTKDFESTQKPVETVYNEINSVLDAVNPNWRVEYRLNETEEIKDATPIRKASLEFQQLMRDGASILNDKEMQLVLATYNLPRDSVQDSIKRFFKRRYEP